MIELKKEKLIALPPFLKKTVRLITDEAITNLW